MNFLNRILLFLLLATVSFSSYAQVVGGMNYKLEKMYVEEKFEDLAYKGEKMLEDDKYKKDPEVYLYVAMAWYEISQMNDEKMKEEYPKALQDAFKYAARFTRKDREGTWYEDNEDFFDDLLKAGIAEAAQYIDDERKRRNAVSTYKYLTKAMPDDFNILFYKGVLENMNRNTGQAERDISMAMAGLVKEYADPKYKPNKISKGLLEDGLIMWSDALMEMNYADSAKKTMNWAVQFFPESEKVKTKAESLK